MIIGLDGFERTPNGSMKDRESQVRGEASNEEYEVETRPDRRLSSVSMFQDAL